MGGMIMAVPVLLPLAGGAGMLALHFQSGEGIGICQQPGDFLAFEKSDGSKPGAVSPVRQSDSTV